MLHHCVLLDWLSCESCVSNGGSSKCKLKGQYNVQINFNKTFHQLFPEKVRLGLPGKLCNLRDISGTFHDIPASPSAIPQM